MRFTRRRVPLFIEWMEEGQLEIENVTLSLHGNKLFVKGEAGDFDIELTEEQVPDVEEKMQAMASGGGGPEDEDDGNPADLPEPPEDGGPEDEEDMVAPSVGGVGRLSGM
jgi:hypothetical protein